MTKDNNKLKIIKIAVSQENQIIPIDIKLSNDIDTCKGIFLSVKEQLEMHTSIIPQIGELSLMFNAKTIHPIHFTAEYNNDSSHKKEFLDLNCSIESNTNITGFYIDYGKTKAKNNAFLPYTLLIYLMCRLSIMEQNNDR